MSSKIDRSIWWVGLCWLLVGAWTLPIGVAHPSEAAHHDHSSSVGASSDLGAAVAVLGEVLVAETDVDEDLETHVAGCAGPDLALPSRDPRYALCPSRILQQSAHGALSQHRARAPPAALRS